MQYTPNYRLNKPEGSDFVDVDALNSNFEKIDLHLGKANEPIYYEDIVNAPSSLPASDVYAWAKKVKKPSYSYTEVGADKQGAATEALNNAIAYTNEQIANANSDLQAETVRAKTAEQENAYAISILNGIGEGSVSKTVDDAIARVIDESPESFDTLKEISDWIGAHSDDAAEMNSKINQNTRDIFVHTSDTDNPHNVTKEQIGLGNVPNVSTNNQTPTFSQAVTRSNITSGETLEVILGKISKVISDLSIVAFSGSYNELTEQPDIPDVGSANITIRKNGTDVSTFNVNQETDTAIDISVPTKLSELNNDIGLITEIETVTEEDVRALFGH